MNAYEYEDESPYEMGCDNHLVDLETKIEELNKIIAEKDLIIESLLEVNKYMRRKITSLLDILNNKEENLVALIHE